MSCVKKDGMALSKERVFGNERQHSAIWCGVIRYLKTRYGRHGAIGCKTSQTE